MVIAPPAMIVSAVVGISVTMFSAWLPARRAGKVPPIAALRELSVDRSGASVRRTVIGVAVAGLGVLSLLAGLGGAGIVLVGVGAVLTLIGVAVLGPVLARPVSSVFGVVVGRRGIAGDIAVRNAQRNPKRTARTASSLMIGVAMVVFISVLASSVKTSIGGSLQDTFTGTHIVDSGAYDGGGGFSPELADEMVADPSVSAVAESRIGSALVDGSTTRLSGFTGSTIGSVFDLGSVDGDMSGLGPNGIAADAEYAAGHGWGIGSTVDVTMASGIDTFVVEATYDDGSEWVGDYFVDIAAFDAHLPDLLDYRIYAVGDDDAVRSMAADYPSTTVLDADEFLGQVTGDIDMMLGVVYALLALAVIIALLGITNTLALSIFERTRELGLLRAVGMVRAQVRTAIRWEAIMIALFGTALGIGVGSFFGWAGVQALHSEGIEHFTYPAVSVAVVALTAALAGAFAAIAPARRAARLDVLQALSAQ
jgi:putative ABC transport system permease protein